MFISKNEVSKSIIRKFNESTNPASATVNCFTKLQFYKREKRRANATCEDLGKLTCTNGAWVPNAKLIRFGLSCPLPLDRKSKSKGKTCVCAFKKAKLYDEAKNSVKRDKISEVVCSIMTQTDLKNKCKKKIQACLKNGNGYFKDPKKDKEYKSWSEPFECVEKWVLGACKK